MNDKTWLIIYTIIGWATSIVFEIQCQSWKRKHGEAITAWIIESNRKDKQILKLQEELENLKAKPVKHGHWIEEVREVGGFFKLYQTYIHCSECGKEHYSGTLPKPNFCDNCGADMRGEGNA